MTDRAQHHGRRAAAIEVVDHPSRLVHDEQRVHPHVAFGMPLRLLFASDERRHLGKQFVDDAEFEGECQADRRPSGAEQQLFDFPPDALVRQVVERNRRGDALALGVHRQFESRRELQRPEHAKAVVAERGRIDDPQEAQVKVGAPVEGIDQLAGQRIPRHRVDREIAPARGVRERQRRIAVHAKALVAAPGLRLAAGQRHIHAGHLVDRETLADRVHASEGFDQRAQPVRGDAEHFEINVFRVSLLQAEQPVTHPAADDQRAASRGANGAREIESERRRLTQRRGMEGRTFRSARRAVHECDSPPAVRREYFCTNRSAVAGATTLRTASHHARGYG